MFGGALRWLRRLTDGAPENVSCKPSSKSIERRGQSLDPHTKSNLSISFSSLGRLFACQWVIIAKCGWKQCRLTHISPSNGQNRYPNVGHAVSDTYLSVRMVSPAILIDIVLHTGWQGCQVRGPVTIVITAAIVFHLLYISPAFLCQGTVKNPATSQCDFVPEWSPHAEPRAERG